MKLGTINVEPAAGALGATIVDIDLSREHPDAVYQDIRRALDQYGVIFFRDQTLTPEQHLAFGRKFGPVQKNVYLRKHPDYPEIGEIVKEIEEKRNIGGDWHSDATWRKDPPLGSILMARELPPVGGDTMFYNMSLAYETLSDGLKHTLSTLKAIHSNLHVIQSEARADAKAVPNYSGTAHPVVTRHARTGKKVLYINATYTVGFEGWTPEESRPLLNMLYEHARRLEFSCRFNWKPGSIAFWDNTQTWHYAINDYPGYRRYMHRVTIEGTEPQAAFLPLAAE